MKLVPLLMGLLFAGVATAQPYGVYPNCVAPAVPIESGSWWIESGDPVPHHIHAGTCLPLARNADCSGTQSDLVMPDGEPFTQSTTVFKYDTASPINLVGWLDQVNVVRESFDPQTLGWQCPGADNGVRSKTCIFQNLYHFDSSTMLDGFDAINLHADVMNRFGHRHFAGLTVPICAGTGTQSRGSLYVNGRGYYGLFNGYATVLSNVSEWFSPSDRSSIPTVSGVFRPLAHHASMVNGAQFRSLLWLDPNTHANPIQYLGAPVGIELPQPHGGMLIYDEPALFRRFVQLDTTGWTNGVHTLLFQTYVTRSEGTLVGELRVQVNVQN